MSRQSEFLELVNLHKGILIKVSRMYFDNPTDQEELQQEIIMRLWKAYPTFKGESQFSSWMYRVSLNTAITFFKKSQKLTEVSLEVAPGVTAEFTRAPNSESDGESSLEDFYAAVGSLNRIEKAVLFLSLEGCAHKEIASHLGIKEGNARVRLSRVKAKLKTIMRKQDNEI